MAEIENGDLTTVPYEARIVCRSYLPWLSFRFNERLMVPPLRLCPNLLMPVRGIYPYPDASGHFTHAETSRKLNVFA
jgi:hypothetical protein